MAWQVGECIKSSAEKAEYRYGRNKNKHTLRLIFNETAFIEIINTVLRNPFFSENNQIFFTKSMG